nr:hypothetical protein [uncultured Acidovorax sp.]
MSYTRPAASAADATWAGSIAYVRPSQSAADASWQTGVVGTAQGAVKVTGAVVAAHGVAGVAQGRVRVTGEVQATHTPNLVIGVAAGRVGVTGSVLAAHGVSGAGLGRIGVSGAVQARHGVKGSSVGRIAVGGAVQALHLRYEVRGEVRLGGVLVDRRVRCSNRTSGELMGQADTVAGRYRVHAGFDESEVYVTAIDLSGGAIDWIPPTANRLVPVLADDTA